MRTVTAEMEYEGERYSYTQEWDETKDYYDDVEDMEQHVHYMWTEGNYSCDCNRLVFMSLDDPDEDSPPCGISVKLVSLTIEGKDLLAPTASERLARIGLIGG